MRKFYLLLLLPILATLPISCTSNPKPRIASWGHGDEWDTRRSIIRAQLAVPDGNTIGEIQIRFSRLPRGSELISGPDELLSSGDRRWCMAPGFAT